MSTKIDEGNDSIQQVSTPSNHIGTTTPYLATREIEDIVEWVIRYESLNNTDFRGHLDG